MQGSAHAIRSLRLGNVLYAQNIASLGNISIKLGLPVRTGRRLLIIELVLEMSGLYCVVNITGFALSFCYFLLIVWSWLHIIFFKSSGNLLWPLVTWGQVSWIFFRLFWKVIVIRAYSFKLLCYSSWNLIHTFLLDDTK